jgi:hypothetical protein
MCTKTQHYVWLYNDAISKSHGTALIAWLINWKIHGYFNLVYRHLPLENEENHEIHIQDKQFPRQSLNSGPPKPEARTLTAWLRGMFSSKNL